MVYKKVLLRLFRGYSEVSCIRHRVDLSQQSDSSPVQDPINQNRACKGTLFFLEAKSANQCPSN